MSALNDLAVATAIGSPVALDLRKMVREGPGAVWQAGGWNEVSAMIAGSMGTLLRVLRPVGATLGIVSLLALQPEPARLARSAAAHELSAANAPRALVLSDQARRFLLLQYRSFSTEFMGCMIGEVQAGVVVVKRIAPADVEPEQSTPSRVIPKQTCERAAWSGTVGMIHSHPTGERCWYYFPGTQVPSSDGQSFRLNEYPVDAIMCGDHVVWIGRGLVERTTPLSDRRAARPAPGRPQRGNGTPHAESSDPVGG